MPVQLSFRNPGIFDYSNEPSHKSFPNGGFTVRNKQNLISFKNKWAEGNRTAMNFGKPNKINTWGRLDFVTLLNPPSEVGNRIESSKRDSILNSHTHSERKKPEKCEFERVPKAFG